MNVYIVLRKIAEAPINDPDAAPYTEIAYVCTTIGAARDYIVYEETDDHEVYYCVLIADAKHDGGIPSWHTDDGKYIVEKHRVERDPVAEAGYDN